MIKLRPDQLRLVQSILHAYVPDREVRVFGSRVQGKVKPTSDVDVCIMGDKPVKPKIIDELRRVFSESTLPMKVDVVEWATLQPGFREIVKSSSTVLQPAER
jgi:predicted nucleotidyltransferase